MANYDFGNVFMHALMNKQKMNSDDKARAEELSLRLKQIQEQREQFYENKDLTLQQIREARQHRVEQLAESIRQFDENKKTNKEQFEYTKEYNAKKMAQDEKLTMAQLANALKVAGIYAGGQNETRAMNRILLNEKIKDMQEKDLQNYFARESGNMLSKVLSSPANEWASKGMFNSKPNTSAYNPLKAFFMPTNLAAEKAGFDTAWNQQKTSNTKGIKQYLDTVVNPLLELQEKMNTLGVENPSISSTITNAFPKMLMSMNKAIDDGMANGDIKNQLWDSLKRAQAYQQLKDMQDRAIIEASSLPAYGKKLGNSQASSVLPPATKR